MSHTAREWSCHSHLAVGRGLARRCDFRLSREQILTTGLNLGYWRFLT
jgi:hypothetical protein